MSMFSLRTKILLGIFSALAVGIVIFAPKVSSQVLGATVFNSQQLAPSASNGYILSTNGTANSWIPNTGGSSFPFTPQTYGNSTSTTIGFLQGLISNGSTTISSLSSGLVGANNGLLYSFASSTLFGYTPLNPTRQITVAGTANQITSSAGAQDLSADRTWTLSLPNHVIFPSSFQATLSTTTNATTTGSQYFTGITASQPLYVDSTGKLGSAGTGTSGNCVSWGANNTLGDAGSACGGGTFSWTPVTNFAVNTNSTTTPIWFRGSPISLMASSTAVFDNASTTFLSVIAGDYATVGYPLLVQSNGTGNNGAFIKTYFNSASPAASDYIGGWDVYGNTTVNSNVSMGAFNLVMDDVTDGQEQSHWSFQQKVAGVMQEITLASTYLTSSRTLTFPNLSGSFALGSYATGFLNGSIPFGSAGLLATSSALTFDSTLSKLTVTNASTTNLSIGSLSGILKQSGGVVSAAVSGTDYAPATSGSTLLLGNGAGGFSNYAGVSCTNQVLTALSTAGASTCSSINNAYWSGTDLSVANGGTGVSTFTSSQLIYGNGTGALTSVATTTATLGLGLSGTLTTINNTTQSLSIATSSLYTGTAGQVAYFSGTNTLIGTSSIKIDTSTGYVGIGSSTPAYPFSSVRFWITTIGKIVGYDSVNGWFGIISPTRSFVLSTATTTTWIASTTNSAYTPYLTMPFAGTLKQVRCTATSTQAFLGAAVTINGSAVTPSYFIASSTVGTEKFTAGNTFTAGQRIAVDFGTTTTDANAKGVSCTFDVFETP